MPLSEKDRSYFRKKIVALRKSLQSLEEELGDERPVLPKRPNSIKQQIEQNFLTGTWRKPDHLKRKKAVASTTA